MNLIMSIFLGIVQGVAEFLPISSSGHLAIFQNFFKMENVEESHLFFTVLLHLGTLISVCVVYRRDIADMFFAVIDMVKKDKKENAPPEEKGRLAIMIVAATLPLILILPVRKYIEQLSGSSAFIGVALLITGCILFFSDKIAQGRKAEKKMTVVDALIVGLSQAIATVPGLSRSGITITTGLCAGFSREFAVRFSFLMSIPAILGANLISLISALKGGVNWSYMPVYLVGVVVAAVVGYFAIRLVKVLVDSNKFGKFSYYCWIVGGLTIILSFIL